MTPSHPNDLGKAEGERLTFADLNPCYKTIQIKKWCETAIKTDRYCNGIELKVQIKTCFSTDV